MRKISFLKLTAGLLVILMAYQAIDAISLKSVRIGRYKQGVADILAQTETVPSRNRNYWYGDNFYRYYYWTNPWHLGVKNFTDASGTIHPYMIANSPQREYNEGIVLVAQYLDDDMNTIHRYFRYAPPDIWVDGYQLNDPMLPGDFVAPDSIEFYGGGNAEIMVRSRVNTWIGMTIDARTLAFSQNHHDQYVIYDRTYTNTGLTQYGTTPTLTDTLNDVYFLRGFRGSETSRRQFGSRYGEYPGDSLRITYNYPARGTYAWDRLGCRNRMWRQDGTFGRSSFYEDIRLELTSGLRDPSQDLPLSRPRARGNIVIRSPADYGPILGGISCSLYGSWRKGRWVTMDPLGLEEDIELDPYINRRDRWEFDVRLQKRLPFGRGMNVTIFADIQNVFDIQYISSNAAGQYQSFGSNWGVDDEEDYLMSLRLPLWGEYEYYEGMVESGELTVGDDKIGDIKSDDKPWIDMPNRDHLTFRNPRVITVGLTFNF